MILYDLGNGHLKLMIPKKNTIVETTRIKIGGKKLHIILARRRSEAKMAFTAYIRPVKNCERFLVSIMPFLGKLQRVFSI